jgi:hypothetical protein
MLFAIFYCMITRVASQNLSRPTFYFRTGPDVAGCPTVQTFNDGVRYGPCNGSDGVQYGPQSRYWAAIRNGGAHCGEQIIVSHGSRSVTLTVWDSCPGCEGDNHVVSFTF